MEHQRSIQFEDEASDPQNPWASDGKRRFSGERRISRESFGELEATGSQQFQGQSRISHTYSKSKFTRVKEFEAEHHLHHMAQDQADVVEDLRLANQKSRNELPVKVRFWQQLQRLMDSMVVEAFVFVVALIDFSLLIYDVDMRSRNQDSPDWVHATHIYFLAVFTIEALLRLFVTGRNLLRSPWLIFDILVLFVTVIAAFLYGVRSPLRMLRILRLFRIVHMSDQVAMLRSVVLFMGTLVQASSILIFSLVLYLFNMLIFSLIAIESFDGLDAHMGQDVVDKFGELAVSQSKQAFSSITSSLLTLFAFSMGDLWREVAMPIVHIRPWALFFFFLYVLIATVLLVGVVFAALVESQNFVKTNQRWMKECEHLDDKKRALQRLEDLFVMMDVDGNGSLTWQEFFHSRQDNKEFDQLLETLDLTEEDLGQLWRVLDGDANGQISMIEFKDTMWRLLSGETKWMVMINSWTTSQVNCRIEQHHRSAMEQFAYQENRLVRIEELLGKCERTTSAREPQGIVKTSTSKGKPTRKSRKQGLPSTEATADERDFRGRVSAINPEDLVNGQASSDEEQILDEEEEQQLQMTKLDTIHDGTMDTEELNQLTSKYMRAVRAAKVAEHHPEVISFWGSGAFMGEAISDRDFLLSEPIQQCDFFVSHSWLQPADYWEHFSRASQVATYEFKKILELNNVLQQTQLDVNMVSKQLRKSKFNNEFTGLLQTPSNVKSIKEITLWVDKCCIPQMNEAERAICVSLIENFLKRCDGLVVLLSWNYFSRLWCIYEWACFLRLHHPWKVYVGCDAFLKSNPDDTLPLYLESIERISVKGAQCYREADRKILEEKVYTYYNGATYEESFAAFERFAQVTAILLMSKQIVTWRARGSVNDAEAWLKPIRDLALRLNHPQLLKVLESAQPAQWFKTCNKSAESFQRLVMAWFENMVVQYLLVERKLAVRKSYVQLSSAYTTGNSVNSFKTQSMRMQEIEQMSCPRASLDSFHDTQEKDQKWASLDSFPDTPEEDKMWVVDESAVEIVDLPRELPRVSQSPGRPSQLRVMLSEL